MAAQRTTFLTLQSVTRYKANFPQQWTTFLHFMVLGPNRWSCRPHLLPLTYVVSVTRQFHVFFLRVLLILTFFRVVRHPTVIWSIGWIRYSLICNCKKNCRRKLHYCDTLSNGSVSNRTCAFLHAKICLFFRVVISFLRFGRPTMLMLNVDPNKIDPNLDMTPFLKKAIARALG